MSQLIYLYVRSYFQDYKRISLETNRFGIVIYKQIIPLAETLNSLGLKQVLLKF